MVEMKAGGEVLNTLGMFEAGTGKRGLYLGKPTIPQLQSIATLGTNMFLTVPAGNTNLAGFIAHAQAWRGIRAYFNMTRKGHVDAMKPSKLVFWDTSMSKDTKKTQKKTASVEGSTQVEGAVVEMDIVEEEKTTCFVSITDATMRSAGRHMAVPAKQVKVDKGKGKRRAESDVEESEDDVRPMKKLQISYV